MCAIDLFSDTTAPLSKIPASMIPNVSIGIMDVVVDWAAQANHG